MPSTVHHAVVTASITDNGSPACAISPTHAMTLQAHVAIADGLMALGNSLTVELIPKNTAFSGILPPTDIDKLFLHPANVGIIYAAGREKSIPETLILV